MKRMELTIDGMSCGHCVASVKKELQKLSGVDVEEVRIGGATLLVDETRTDEKKISDAIAAAGYVLARTAS